MKKNDWNVQIFPSVWIVAVAGGEKKSSPLLMFSSGDRNERKKKEKGKSDRCKKKKNEWQLNKMKQKKIKNGRPDCNVLQPCCSESG